MNFNNSIPPNEESRWTAFLNGEPNISDVSKPEADEMEDYTASWEAAGTSYSYSAANPNEAWLTIQKEMAKSDKRHKNKVLQLRVFKYAAMIVMIMGVGFAAYQVVRTPEKHVEVPVIMAVAKTDAHPVNITVITLPDGSIVKMNASTQIDYPESFSARVRKVKLSGEAFFEVTRDTLRPFIIETTNASVEVLGTSFNVSAYPSASLVVVNVKTGKVKLTKNAKDKSDQKSAILPAGERGWLRISNGEMGQAVVLAPNYSSWSTKELSFQRTPLSEAFTVLENTYHVRIKMENADIGRIPYTANFANLKLEYIIEVIARTHKLTVKKDNDEIVFAKSVNKESIDR